MGNLLDGAVIRPSGESAFVVEFGDVIDPAAGLKVSHLANAIDAAGPASLPGLREVVPTFRSLLVLYDDEQTDEDTLLAGLKGLGGAEAEAAERTWSLPVCLDGAMAEDIDECADALGISADELRTAFLGSRLQVGMYGFVPGFPYLSGLDPLLAVPRRLSPRPPVPKYSVIIAGGMAALVPITVLTGWYVIGRMAIELFRPDETPMVPFAVGDILIPRRVDEAELIELTERVDGGVRQIP